MPDGVAPELGTSATASAPLVSGSVSVPPKTALLSPVTNAGHVMTTVPEAGVPSLR